MYTLPDGQRVVLPATQDFTMKEFFTTLIMSLAVLITALLPPSSWAEQTSRPNQSLLKPADKAPAPLTALMQSASRGHPSLRQAQARLDAARANLRGADKALYNPELELASENTDVRTTTIQLSQTIDWSDQRGARTAVAQSEFNQASAELEQAELDLIQNQLNTLADHLTRMKLANVSEQRLGLMQDFVKVAQRRYQAGDLNQVELNLARLAYSEALMGHAQVVTEATSAMQQLVTYFGPLATRLAKVPESLPTPRVPADLDTYLTNLPEMRAHTAGITALRQSVTLRTREKSWDPTIAIRAGEEGKQDLIGASISVPLNIRNTYQANVDVAQQELIQKQQSAGLAFRQLRARVITNTERFRLLQQAWGQWQTAGKSHVDQQLVLLKRLWQAGDISTTDYLVQLNQALDTQASGIELRGQFWNSGFDWLHDTASIKSWLNLNSTNLKN
ncbi:MAG: TolC family protein [Gammaproteobacteria bacterium]|nr:MAG: TolC family protein [Gammaproteobacteria bacterium]